jgi:hypothetical protein
LLDFPPADANIPLGGMVNEAASEIYHVVPLRDLVSHEDVGDDCICGPHVQYFSGGRVVVHHALDGRHADKGDWPVVRAHEVAAEYRLEG